MLNQFTQVIGEQPVSASNPVPMTGTMSMVPNASIQGVTNRIAVTPLVTAGTYAVSKVIGAILPFVGILPPQPFGAVLESITVKFKGSAQTVGFWVSVFDSSPAGTFTDTNTAAILASDTQHLLGAYHLVTPFSLLGTHTIYQLDGIGKAINGLTQNLYAVVVPDATTGSLVAGDMTVELAVLWG